jgi:hypothetical protein
VAKRVREPAACSLSSNARNRSVRRRSGATYSRSSFPAAAERSTASASRGARELLRNAALTPRILNASTWSSISAMSGDTTTAVPGLRIAGTW